MKSIRLQAISEFIEPHHRLADIGCDHGYLGLYAIERGIKFLQLIDNKSGPLASAQSNFESLNTDANVIFTLGDGLKQLDERVNVIAICGVGGELMTKILHTEINKAKAMDLLILQPNLKIPEVRMFLSHHSFAIIQERIVSEKGKAYEIIVAQFQKDAKPISAEDCYFGPILRKERSPIFIKKYQKRYLKLSEILKKNSVKDERLQLLEQEMNMIRKEKI